MTREQALEKLISVRHHCFVNRDDSGYLMAFRDLNRLYVDLRDSEWLENRSRMPFQGHTGRSGARRKAGSRLCWPKGRKPVNKPESKERM